MIGVVPLALVDEEECWRPGVNERKFGAGEASGRTEEIIAGLVSPCRTRRTLARGSVVSTSLSPQA